MVIKIAVFRINWETDGESVPELPNKVVMDIDLGPLGGDVNNQICDWLGDEYGWLVNDYEIEGYSPISAEKEDISMIGRREGNGEGREWDRY